MTRRTFIAFLTALLPANWLRSSDAPKSGVTFSCTGNVADWDKLPPWPLWHGSIPPAPKVDGLQGYRFPRVFIFDDGATYGSPSHGPGLCDLAYRKP